ncbi:MAG: D-2-hydroxyacid dehydrogenase [Chloroflexi bacterium]|nr:D-2-hydroxyacid dehydrogenase [Chloroflexota bacterium]
MSPGRKVVCLYPFSPEVRAGLDRAVDGVRLVHAAPNTQAFVDSLEDPDVEALLASFAPADPRRTPRLRWVASVTAGVEEIVATAPWRSGITVTNGSGLHAVALAEYTLAGMLQHTQRVAERVAAQRERRWPEWSGPEWVRLAGTRLRGSTAAILGYGSVGREIGRILAACGVRVLAAKARPQDTHDAGFRLPGTGDPEAAIPERIVGFDGVGAIVREADFVVITVPLTERTRGLVDAAFLAEMRRTACLVNVGRGGHVDEAALDRALREGTIAGAVLDVFEDEPLPRHSPLWTAPNVIIAPHVAGAGGFEAFWPDAAALFAENLRRWVAGQPLLNVVDGARGY